MATLALHEAMGAKVDREAIATLVLPQLWAMSMGPREYQRIGFDILDSLLTYSVLNADQFGRFMA
jgi:SCY1-like protein 2